MSGIDFVQASGSEPVSFVVGDTTVAEYDTNTVKFNPPLEIVSTTAASVSAADSGFVSFFHDSASNKLGWKNTAGTTTEVAQSGGLPLSLNFLLATTISGTYIALDSFLYRGTDNDPPIAEVRWIVSVTNVDADVALRLFDVTNTQTIAEVVDPTLDGIVKTHVVDTGVANLPAQPAIVEVQMRRTAGTLGSAVLHSVHLYA